MTLKDLGEFGLIDRISSRFKAPDGVIGIGDDCAVLPQNSGRETLVSTDMLVEGTHFLLDDIPARDLGWKSAAVNFSDIAACGGKVTGSFLSLALPQGISEEWMDGFVDGFREMSQEAGAPLLGGDVTSSPDRLCINVTVLGETAAGRAKLRSTARPGDLVCVTGPLGDSAAGLKLILEGLPRDERLISRHYRPRPRLKEGLALSGMDEVHAMMDISDGVASDLRHILDASGVGAIIDTAALPLSPGLIEVCDRYGWDAVRLALCGGEDYELLFTVTPEGEAKITIPHHVIGRVTGSGDLVWAGAEDDYIGFRHF